ncbi:TetR family transcriptional regulator [Saccharibacillus sp. O23]|uniref:TetR/AcrR family transcriptional regulator n=1 Tax=Saccharibacillus sp. O23 TaxID=2009338 RepID=UPI000B4E7D8D|nr:TetR/AcrR family transcriptional regulator [Saccharibacillus sp. O23]OWR32704.1 TetR family transcriptional regulator [Saccharibacillus sp. O23]
MARNKEFDEKEVLEKAMGLFLAQGYEKTSMQELVEHMGIHRRSLYDTFGDKHALFMQALTLYQHQMDDRLAKAALKSSSALAGIALIFNAMIDKDPEEPKGCLFVNTAVELGPRDTEAEQAAGKGFGSLETRLRELIIKGQQQGEIPDGLDASIAAENLHNSLLGIRVLARTSASRDKLRRIKEASLAALR